MARELRRKMRCYSENGFEAARYDRREHRKNYYLINFDRLYIERRNFRNVVITTLTFLLLKLNGDTMNWTLLDTLHEMGSKPGDLGNISCMSGKKLLLKINKNACASGELEIRMSLSNRTATL